MDVAITTITANRSHVEALNGFVSMRTLIVVRHRNVDGVHRIALGVSADRLPRPSRKKERSSYTPMPMKPLPPCRSPRLCLGNPLARAERSCASVHTGHRNLFNEEGVPDETVLMWSPALVRSWVNQVHGLVTGR